MSGRRKGDRRRERPAIVMVASGTSDPRAAEVFSHIDAIARSRYGEHQVRWAYTSQFVLAKLKRQGIDASGLDDVVAQLNREGCRSTVLQSLHVVPGGDYDKIAAVDTRPMRSVVGAALLADEDSISAVVDALADEIREDAFNVVVCHGSRKHPDCNRQLVAFAGKAEAAFENLVVCSLIGQPGTERLSVAKLAAEKRGASRPPRVHFIPLMVTAGMHLKDDVLGEKPGSWKNIIAAAETTCARPLGYNRKVLDVFFEHLDAALADLEGNP